MTKTKIGCEETKVPMPDQAVAVQGVEQVSSICEKSTSKSNNAMCTIYWQPFVVCTIKL